MNTLVKGLPRGLVQQGPRPLLSSQRLFSRNRPCQVLCRAGNDPVRYAVVGAGLAGIATAWHLLHQVSLQQQQGGRPVEVHVFDAHGIAAGGTGAAAGLLHPFSPKGKMLWKAQEAVGAALELVAVAEAVAGGTAARGAAGPQPDAAQGGGSQGPLAWRNGMVRPASTPKQAADFLKVTSQVPQSQNQGIPSEAAFEGVQQAEAAGVAALEKASVQQLQALVPGLQVPALKEQAQVQVQEPNSSNSSGQSEAGGAGEAQGAVPNSGTGGDSRSDSNPRSSSRQVSPQAGEQAEGLNDSSDSVGKKKKKKPERCGLMTIRLYEQEKRRQERAKAARELSGEELQACAGLHIPGGVVLDVHKYCAALWSACQAAAPQLAPGSQAVLHAPHAVHSIQSLHAGPHGPFEAVVVAAGAAAGSIQELRGMLPIQICQGYSLLLEPGPQGQPFPPTSPSILGSTYLSAQGTSRLVVGATRSFGWDAAAALDMCRPQQHLVFSGAGGGRSGGAVTSNSGSSGSSSGCSNAVGSSSGAQGSNGAAGDGGATPQPAAAQALQGQGLPDSALQAAAELVQSAAAVWPPVEQWAVKEVRSGMRALPPRTPAGSIPMVGRVDLSQGASTTPASNGSSNTSTSGTSSAAGAAGVGSRMGEPGSAGLPPTWVVVGLGARGLVYHAWLAKALAQAVVKGDEGLLLQELKAWKQLRPGEAVFEGVTGT